MSRFFALSHDTLTPEQEKELAKVLDPEIWWHWLPNSWLIKDTRDELTATAIRDKFRSVNRAVRCMVVQVEPIQWAGATRPDAKGRSMTKWIQDHWEKP